MDKRFKHSFTKKFKFKNLTAQQFLVIAVESVKKAGWEIQKTSDNGLIAFTTNTFVSAGENFRIIIHAEGADLISESTESLVDDLGKNRANVKIFIKHFEELQKSLTTETLNEIYETLKPDFIPLDESELIVPTLSIGDKLSAFLFFFKPTEGYFITPILINLNILIFILMVLSGVNALLPDSDSLILWGANIRPLTTGGEWWRLLTCCFLHIGVIHLLMNMYALVYIGVLLEPQLGRSRFLTAYLLTGIASSVTSLWWHDITISAGASGAIFGMYGVFLAMLTTNLIEKKARMTLLTSIGIFVVYNLANGFKEGIDNAAHIGGLVSGLIIGYGFYPSLRVKVDEDEYQEYDLKKISIGVLTFVILFVCYLIYLRVPVDTESKFMTQAQMAQYDLANYTERMKNFETNESMALSVLQMPDSTAREIIIRQIKNQGIVYWRDNIELIYEVEKLRLPPFIHRRNRLLFDYCNLRIDSYKLICQTLETGGQLPNPQIEDLNKQINDIINKLKEDK